MRHKKLLSVLCAFIMLFSAGAITLGGVKDAFAAENTYYYGTSLVSAGEGSATVASSLSQGVKITFNKASEASSADYRHSLDMNRFAVDFKFDGENFQEIWFTFTDADNSSKWVTVRLNKDGDSLQYKLEDNYGNETAYASSGVTVSALTSEGGVTLGYTYANDGNGNYVGAFTFGGRTLAADGIETTSFYKNIADMSFGVEGVSGDLDSAVMYITAVTNSNGEQSLVTSNSKFTDENRVAPVIIPKEDGVDAIVTSASPVTKAVNAASNSTYSFPYYCLDILGSGWAVTTSVEQGAAGDKVEGKTEHALGNAGSVYTFRIYAKESDAEPLVTLNVTAVDDDRKVSVDNAKFIEFINASDEIGTGSALVEHIVAPSENNTFEFPHIYRDDYENIFAADPTGLDTFDNVTIQVGYRAPGDTGEFTYVNSYAVRINAEGLWTFRYKVTDAAGNETESQVFYLRVFDETAPTIKTETTVEITVNEGYTIPSATITDNASGVDTAYSVWTLYEMNADGSKGNKIANIRDGEEGYENSILKDGVLTPTALTPDDRDGSYILVYEARDYAGNVADNVEVTIKVVAGTPDYADNPWNDFFRTALIVVACLAGTGIIILIFVKPRERELR